MPVKGYFEFLAVPAAALLVLVVLLVPACRARPAGATTDSPLEVTPAVVDFGQVYVGATASRTLTLRNVGQAARVARLDVPAPFASRPVALTVGGGDSLTVEFTASPPAEGVSSATVRVDETDVELRVAALAVPVCAASGPCEPARFDLAGGVCVQERRPDGAACSSTCLTNGVCSAGVCRGQAPTCDDQNLCTQDACGEVAGCVHVPIACPPADDPCQAAYCDVASGCQKRPVEDGVRCGPDDCARNTARVCIAGACVTRQRPQGELCFETLVGVAGGPGRVDARGEDARFFGVRTAATDRWGNTWVFGGGDVRRVTAGGVVTTVIRSAGGTQPLDGVGVGTVVRPELATTDAFGNAYVFDASRSCLRKVTPAGVLSTVGGACTVTGPTADLGSLAVLSDGRAVVATGASLALFLADGGLQPLHPGFGPLAESATGELLFWAVGDAGQPVLLSLATDGTTRALRGWPAQTGPTGDPLFFVSSLAPSGEVLAHYDPGAGCLLAVNEVDGGLGDLGRLATDCRWSAPNVTTFTGSPVFFSWMGRDDRGYVFERGLLLRRLEDGGFADLAGLMEHPGTADGTAPDARLSVTAGFGFSRRVTDAVTVRPDGTVLLSDDRGQTLRTYADDGGLKTLDAGLLSVTTLQPAPGGAWVKSGIELRWLAGEVLGPPRPLAPSLAGWSPSWDSEAAFEPGAGAWLLEDQLLVRLDAQYEVAGVIRGWRALRDGPLPDVNLDGGWVDTDAGTADFSSLRAPVELGPGRFALLDRHAVRVLSPAGLETLAGAATPGFVDGPAPSARFNGPLGLALAPNGDLYVADTENNAIRVLTSAGQVRTVGRLTDRPSGIAVAPNGDVYVLVRHALLRGR